MRKQRLRDLSTEARRQTDESFAALFEQLFVDARVIVKAFQIPHRVEVLKVQIADVVFREQDQVIVAPRGPIEAVVTDIGLAAKNRLHAGCARFLIEVDRAEHVAVIGQRHRVHSHRRNARKQILEPDRSVKQAVLAVDVQVRKLGNRHGRGD